MTDDRWAIQDLKHRYARCVDARDWEGLAATLAPEMRAEYRADLITEGADALIAELKQRLTAERITIHHLVHPSVEVNGDTAVGTWTMTDRTVCTDIGLVVEGISTAHDQYRRDPDRGWLIVSTRYERIYEATMALPAGYALRVGPGA